MSGAWDRANPEKVREYKRKWREANREKERVASLQRYYANRDERLAYGKEWAKKNPDKVRARGRRHDAKPERKLPRGDYRARHERWRATHLEDDRARRRDYQARRRQDPVQRLIDAMRRRVRHVCNGNARGCFDLFGYTADQLRWHLQQQFKSGMSWDNYGEWHVDHRHPVSAFVVPDQLQECFALSNLQPLWAAENFAKHAKVGG